MKGYKVFKVEDDEYYSVIVNVGRVKYKKKGWNKQPKDQGPFAVFKKLKQAKKFDLRERLPSVKTIIRKIKYKPSKETSMWRTYYGSKDHWLLKSTPKGTILAEAVKIGH